MNHKINSHTKNFGAGVKAIIFDLGNVLIDFDHTIAAKKISRFTDKTWQEIFNLFFDSALTGLFEEGKISPENFFREVKKMLDLKLDYAEFVPIWNDIFFLTEKNRIIYNLVKGLKRKYKIALLSNINILHFGYLKEKFPVFDVFHYVLTSFEIGVRKPHPLIYEKTLEKLGVSPQNVFYTDDRPELIEKAKELGIRAFIFEDAEHLKQSLIENGININ